VNASNVCNCSRRASIPCELNPHVYEVLTLMYPNFVFSFALNSYFGKQKFRVDQFVVVRLGIGPDKSHCLDNGVRKGMQVLSQAA
jgi:hypothetical protein